MKGQTNFETLFKRTKSRNIVAHFSLVIFRCVVQAKLCSHELVAEQGVK
jgi:hypothetical protein